MFHLPRILWKHSEGGLMKMLVGDLTDPMMLIKVRQPCYWYNYYFSCSCSYFSCSCSYFSY